MTSREPDPSKSDPLIGQSIAGQFEIVKQLGAGGMGAVYLAEQRDMGRQVVIKVMHPELTVGNPQAVERFKREARAVAALNHPHIVQVYVFGQADDGRMYLAMEYIEGRDLASEVARGALAQGRALKILDQVAAALIEAHSRGIVHRDLKPENVMLADRHGNPDWVKVLDFGIAKIHSAHSGQADGGMEAAALTQQGAIFGTPRYMAPEQITGQPIDARTDLYALGVIFYEMLTGEHPFRAHSALDYLVKHVQEQVVMPSVGRPGLGVHPRVEHILQRLVAKEPADRFQSAAELQREVRVAMGVAGVALTHTLSVSADAIVQAVQDSERAATVTAAEREALREPRSRRGLWWGLLGLGVVGGGAAAFVVATSGQHAKDDVPPVVAQVSVDASAAEAPDTGPTHGTNDAASDTTGGDTVTVLAAGAPIEGFPVPAGTTLVVATARELRLESSATPKAILGFYAGELAGRVKGVPNGFEFTDPTSPWMSLTLWAEGDRVSILVGRREAAAAGDVNDASVNDASVNDASVDTGGEGERDEEVASATPDAGPSQAGAPVAKKPTAAKPAARTPVPTEAAKKAPGEVAATPTPETKPGAGEPVVAHPDLVTRPNRIRNPIRLRPGVVTEPVQPQKPVRVRPRF
jgi:serine/threonine-protein kinase